MNAAIYTRILLTTLCLLALTTSASADCAWILWTADIHRNGLWHPNELVMQQGYNQFEERVQHAKDALSGGKVKAMCLPDTVDPRGPKGK